MKPIRYIILLLAIFGWSELGRGQTITLEHDTIDFGRVRVGTQRDSVFTLHATGGTVPLVDYHYRDSVKDQDFTIDSLKDPVIDDGSSLVDSLHFRPSKEGRDTERIRIRYVNGSSPLLLVLIGEGVAPRIVSASHTVRSIRVDDSLFDTLVISNRGSDTTAIDSIGIIAGSDTIDFRLFGALPSHASNTTLDYSGQDTSIRLPLRFYPRSVGAHTAVLFIHTIDGDTILSTIHGTGLEPLVVMPQDTVAFDTIHVTNAVPAPVDTFFTISNLGTFPGQILALTHSDTNFHPDATVVGQTLDTGASIRVNVQFVVNGEGDFTDSVRLTTDTRYSLYGSTVSKHDTLIVLKAHVRTPPLIVRPIFFDTIRTCTVFIDSLDIHNPAPIAIRIDTITFDSTASGLSFNPGNPFGWPINIPADSDYMLYFAYSFPPDSLNGLQQITLHLVERHADGVPTIGTATVLLFRKRPELTLHAQLPTFVTSANDVDPLRLPITVEGPREGVHELDDWTLALTFSNDLFEPTGLDTSGGLVTAHDTTPFSLATRWDQPSRTYIITVRGAKLSDSNTVFNDLLFRVKMRAYLTADTVVTVTPVLTFVTHPCAYNLHPFTLTIPYADDCGDVTLRAFLRDDPLPLRVTSLWPNPAGERGISINYEIAQSAAMTATVCDASGNICGRDTWSSAAGRGMRMLPSELLPSSGAAYVTTEARSASGMLLNRRTCKFTVEK
ncbi:MAG: hypothetical protein Q8922_04365 [Bacteroidota bacterium]|nr:hypothetical protein [Bacteroidota bacterium]MDP4231814.1 hypothetical protein [Bacteroidota bacterium]MDP4242700.1 hypothetical protein [Bacteroidota bacterium]MDP4287151.1 hypothetical protein [Bacteroidota bacterium]